MALVGEMPLPPYIAGRRPVDDRDIIDYQTMFASEEGAVAAPTAGLHFTPELMKTLLAAGVATEFVTLHVGAGTFLPVKANDVSEHRMQRKMGRGQPGNGRAFESRPRSRPSHHSRGHDIASASRNLGP